MLEKLTDEEWSDFDLYTSRVKSFRWAYEKETTGIINVLCQLNLWRPQKFLPHVKNIHWAPYVDINSRELSYLEMFTAPSLRQLYICSPLETVTTPDALDSLAKDCPDLAILEINSVENADYRTLFDDCIAQVVIALPKLRSFTSSKPWSICSYALSHLPLLEHLRINAPPHWLEPNWQDSGRPQFPGLRRLEISSHFGGLYHTPKLRSLIERDQLRSIIIDGVGAQFDLSQMHKLFQSMSLNPSLEKIHLIDRDASHHTRLLIDDFLPLLDIGGLTELRVSFDCESLLSDTDLALMAESWPKLQCLQLGRDRFVINHDGEISRGRKVVNHFNH